jgi:hypothetical protein
MSDNEKTFTAHGPNAASAARDDASAAVTAREHLGGDVVPLKANRLYRFEVPPGWDPKNGSIVCPTGQVPKHPWIEKLASHHLVVNPNFGTFIPLCVSVPKLTSFGGPQVPMNPQTLFVRKNDAAVREFKNVSELDSEIHDNPAHASSRRLLAELADGRWLLVDHP